MEKKHEQLSEELSEKREALVQAQERQARLELHVSTLEQHMEDKNKHIGHLEASIKELTSFKQDSQAKLDELVQVKHELDVEQKLKTRIEAKCEEQRDEIKRHKQKLGQALTEANELRNEMAETKIQLETFKNKLNMISDRKHDDYEKNSAMQDELNEAKKKLELVEIKCESYSQKFDLLLKKYENRKLKHKNKIEKLW